MANPMTNSQIVDKVLKGTNLYQLGVPNPTQVGIERTYRYMSSPNNNNIWNTFVEGLFRMVGTQLIRNREYINPLAKFKRVNVNRQQSIQEIGFHLVKARAYDQFDVDSFWKEHPPVIDVAYHTQNRQDKYKISINPAQLESAFLQEYGLSNFVSGALQQPINSDNHDEYNIMLDLMAKYENKWGFYKVQVPELIGDDQAQMEYNAKQFVKAVRTIAGNWSLEYSGLYNGYHLPVFTPLGATYLITTPAVMASIDVDVLAAAFNVSNAELQQRTVLVSKIPVDNCLALLVDEDWFVCGDTLYENRSWENPDTLSTNYFLHHWEVLSTSPMLNCVAFVTTEGTVNETVTVTPTGTYNIGMFDADGNAASEVVLGERNYVKGFLDWTVNPADPKIPDDFMPSDFDILSVGIPAQPEQPAVEESAEATSSNSSLTVEVTAATFGTKVDQNDGSYTFEYHTDHWHLGNTVANIVDYGISVTGTPATGDTITVDYISAKDEVPATEASELALNSRTYVDNSGMLHFQAAVKSGMSVTIKGTSTYNTDGVGKATVVEATKTFTIE